MWSSAAAVHRCPNAVLRDVAELYGVTVRDTECAHTVFDLNTNCTFLETDTEVWDHAAASVHIAVRKLKLGAE